MYAVDQHIGQRAHAGGGFVGAQAADGGCGWGLGWCVAGGGGHGFLRAVGGVVVVATRAGGWLRGASGASGAKDMTVASATR